MAFLQFMAIIPVRSDHLTYIYREVYKYRLVIFIYTYLYTVWWLNGMVYQCRPNCRLIYCKL